jgi:hypothetical protein
LAPLVLSEDERHTLENWAKRRRTAQGLALRARIVLACAQGGSNVAVAALQVDQDRRPDHRPYLPLLLTHLRTGSLAILGH